MEVIILEAILPQLVELCCEEVVQSIIASKCCMWSKNKWRKVMKYLHSNKDERLRKVSMILEETAKQHIFDYAVKIDGKKITNL